MSAGMLVFQALLFAKHLPRFCCWLSGYKLNSKNGRKFYIKAIDFWVLYLGKEAKNTAEYVFIKKIFIRTYVNKDFVHSSSKDLYKASTRAML